MFSRGNIGGPMPPGWVLSYACLVPDELGPLEDGLPALQPTHCTEGYIDILRDGSGGTVDHIASFNADYNRAVANYQAPYESIEGPWEGRWLSDHNGHSGKLKCIVPPIKQLPILNQCNRRIEHRHT